MKLDLELLRKKNKRSSSKDEGPTLSRFLTKQTISPLSNEEEETKDDSKNEIIDSFIKYHIDRDII